PPIAPTYRRVSCSTGRRPRHRPSHGGAVPGADPRGGAAPAPRPAAPGEVVELLGEFGLRPSELFHLTWGSVDWSLGQGANRGALRVEEQGLGAEARE